MATKRPAKKTAPAAKKPAVAAKAAPAKAANRKQPEWLEHFLDYAEKNPAATLVGVIVVLLAFMLFMNSV